MTDENKKRFYSQLGKTISIKRNEVQLSQAQVAERVSMSRASIVNIEKGRQYPPAHLLWSLSKVFNIELEDLFPEFDLITEKINPNFEKLLKSINPEKSEIINSFLQKRA